ncbi:pimeloyl-ACP methyl ester carboxylesterase [Nocardia transvalensis]|uniref:Pimeloyl-ACP methyl ester carboxylesterase n=1 Tax=Nocardia transvalensis TaxID=37333 RepID=A0A7W9PDT5_9NOCA|nr:alpha/beta hydrolase [Nocardia transvalensis]MBB5914272.1 pimeloyl-ACP methyl ester carboxylesterase [Nocardia transvalensis]
MAGTERTARMVDVPGARLYSESVGSGPALILIAGGGGDAGVYEEIAALLAERFTVITFDRRGNSRSAFTTPDAAVDVGVQASDVVAVLDAHGIERAHLFGTSGGAVIALEVLVRQGARVTSAVVHEPPVVQLLPEEDPARREITAIGRLAVEKSPLRAFAAFGVITAPHLPAVFRSAAGQSVMAGATRVGLAVGAAVRALTRRPPSTMTRMLGNAELLLRRELPAFCADYRPDLEALRAVVVPWWIGVGADSAGRPYAVAAQALAGRLNTAYVEFPGGHTAYQLEPEAFAERLCTVVDRARR